MNNTHIVVIENHRSRERIKDMGEVFTPDGYVRQLLSLIDEKHWSDENVIFFEPTAGHGNIVIPLVEKRILGLSKKYSRNGLAQPVLHAVANAINTVWAVDICPTNVDVMRARVFDLVCRTLSADGFDFHCQKSRSYLAHIACSLIWQVQVNEVLSSLSDESTARLSASRTKVSRDWLKANTHQRIDFKLDWCAHFSQSQKNGVIPIIYQRALRFIETFREAGKARGYGEFLFTKNAIENFSGQCKLHAVQRTA